MKNRVSRSSVWNRKGQSILEYLVIATIIVGAIILVGKPGGLVDKNIKLLFTGAGDRTGDAASHLGKLKTTLMNPNGQ